ncbi:MAG TPA: hypothetical protein ENH01_04010 [Nitrospirae bacterium]|nr:hypothetical protein [Nitrospirota bacterium]
MPSIVAERSSFCKIQALSGNIYTPMNNKFRLYFVILIFSVATLTLEVLQLRVFAYSLLRSLAHIVVSIALLGIGIGSISVALVSGINKIKEEKFLAYLFLGFSVSVLVTHIIFAAYFEQINQDYNFPRLWLFSIIFSIPYIFFGAALTFIFKKYVQDVPKLYSVNLIGSGLGCLIPLLVLRPLGAEKLIIIISLMGALGALLYIFDISKKAAVAAIAYTIFLFAGIQYADVLFNFKSKPHGGLSKIASVAGATREFSTWDPLGRIEVYTFGKDYSYLFLPDPVPIKEMFQDGDAGSLLLNVREDKYDYTNFFNGSIFSLVYQLRKDPDTLVIGLGGGPDILRALHFNSKKITGVEINRTTVKIIKETFRDFVGDPYGKDNVTIVNMDGRYFARVDKNKYDVIQIAGADTDTSNLTSGALAVSENYLYTTQAFKDYLDSLKDGGIFSIIRFGPREPMLIVSTVVAAMREMGIPDPYKNFIVVKQAICVNVLIKNEPFSLDEIRSIERIVKRIDSLADNVRIPVNDIVGYAAIDRAEILYLPLPDWNNENSFTAFMDSVKSYKEAEYVSAFPSNIAPLTDDKPFFFQYEKPENILKYRNSVIYNLFKTVVQIFAFSILLIFLPVYLLRRKHTRIRYNFNYVIYFLSLGIGFMFVEIGLIQKSVLFLGHPTYSFIAVVFSILLSSGLGSLASGFFKQDDFKLIAASMAAVVIMILLYMFYMEDIFRVLLPRSTWLRMIVIGLFLSPLGFAMGIPFPRGLQMLGKRDMNFIPVAMGINSVASVLGASSSVPFAMLSGFSAIFLTAAVVYSVGLISVAIKR